MKLSYFSTSLEDKIPLFLIGLESENGLNKFKELEKSITDEILKNDILNMYRGTDFSRLTNVLKHGVEGDNPTDAFWAIPLSMDKALEYGGYPKIILCYDFEQCKPSFKRVKNTIENQDQISELQKLYKSHLKSKDDKEIWFSMFPENNNSIATAYEMEYGYYIPKDQKKALKYILALTSGEDWLVKLITEFVKYGIKIEI